jgi:hypothetical protein
MAGGLFLPLRREAGSGIERSRWSIGVEHDRSVVARLGQDEGALQDRLRMERQAFGRSTAGRGDAAGIDCGFDVGFQRSRMSCRSRILARKARISAA